MNLSGKQWVGIIGVILNTLMTSTALFTKLWGADVASMVIMGVGTVNTMFSGIGVILASQTNTVRDVLAMPGVEHISVNSQANGTLAAMAVNPDIDKIAPTRAAMDDIAATIKGS